MQPTSDSRILQPVMERFRSDGAPCVRLSPSKSLRNATVIYEAIKSVPGNTILRGDFDRKGKPLLVFVPGEKKHIGKIHETSPIRAKNIEADRQDMINFISSIAKATQDLDHPDQQSLVAAAKLNKLIKEASIAQRDVHAQELKAPLRVLSSTFKRVARQQLIANDQRLYRQISRIQSQRFKQFGAINNVTIIKLCQALKPVSASRYLVDTQMSVHEMKRFLRRFRTARAKDKLRFYEYLRRTPIPEDVHFFAKRWIAISQPKPTKERIQLDTQSWAKEFDKICPMIVSAYKDQAHYGTDWMALHRPPIDPMPDLPALPPAVVMPAPSRLTTAVLMPKTPVTRALSAHESAHEVSLLSSPEGVVHHITDQPAQSVKELQQEKVDVETQLGGSMLINTPFASNSRLDSLLIYELEALMSSDKNAALQAPQAEYRPIRSATETNDQLESARRGTRDAGILYRAPKQEIRTLSGLSSDSLLASVRSSPSTLASSPDVSATEVDSHSLLASPLPQASGQTSDFNLQLELSETSQSFDDAST